MLRAGVFIGVDRSGGLQRLNDAASGAKRMHEWAIAQGMDPSMAHLLTDSNHPRVTPDMIFGAIEDLLDGPGADQLIVYFAGHGVNINRGEKWLLSQAPGNANAAVDVAGSVELARYCGIQHVAIISDACRVAPEGIQAQNVRGSDIFPNQSAVDRARPVDQFFACVLGRTAAELRDPGDAASTFTALYTKALLHGLAGGVPELLESSTEAGDAMQYVRPRRLQRWLEEEVPRRVRELRLEGRVNQNPDAIITSDGNWLSRLRPAASLSGTKRSARRVRVQMESTRPPQQPPTTLATLSRALIRTATTNSSADLSKHLDALRLAPIEGALDLVQAIEAIAAPFSPHANEMRSGIKVRGARIARFDSPGIRGEILDPTLLQFQGFGRPAVNVLLEFEDGTGTVIPVIRAFIAALTFSRGELVDVSYEPTVNTERWHQGRGRIEELRKLRAVAAMSSQQGRFRLEGVEAEDLARRMQVAKGVDPTLALYAAYAYHDMQHVERIWEMARYQRADLGITFFDLALLGRRLVGERVRVEDHIVPFTPLLAQGWTLLHAHRVRLHPALQDLQHTLRDSLWSLYDAIGVAKLREVLHSMEER